MPYSFKGTSDTLAVDANNTSVIAGAAVIAITASNNIGITNGTVGNRMTFGTDNTFIGQKTLVNTGSHNTFIGSTSGILDTSGSSNVFLGSGSGSSNTTGSFNTFVGRDAGKANTAGLYSTFVGYQAGLNSTGDDNSFFGVNAGLTNTTGSANVFFGEISGYSNTTGSSNTFIGLKAGYNVTTGSNNTVIGSLNFDATHTTGNNNTLIGTGLAGYGNITNTVIISDGNNTKNIIADSASFRTTAPQRVPQFTVAALPAASTSGVGAMCYATNGRKAAEGAAAGTGVPVFSNGTLWLCFYNNLQVTA